MVNLAYVVGLHFRALAFCREEFTKTFRGKVRHNAEHVLAMDAIADALYCFADTLEVSCLYELHLAPKPWCSGKAPQFALG